MAVTTLDPKTALIVVDLQKGIIARETAHPIPGVVKNSVALLDAFRKHKLPVVLVNVTGGAPGRNEAPRMPASFPAEFAELIPELKQQPSDHTVTKRTWGAFTNTRSERLAEEKWGDPGRPLRRRHVHRRGIHRAFRAGGRLQRHARHRRDDRHERGRA